MNKKTIIVTGASRGIGKSIALKFAGEGYDTAICSQNSNDALQKTAIQIRECGVDCISFCGNMGNLEEATAFFHQIEQQWGHLDVLVNNAGRSQFGLLQEMTIDEWNSILQSNLTSVFCCSKLAIPMMLVPKQGKIINISSVWGCQGASLEAAYSATKGGVNALTRALAKELAPSGIQVNAIACGLIDTSMNACLSPDELNAITEEIPAGRMGSPEEVADLAFQLATGNAYLTGQILRLDGGWI